MSDPVDDKRQYPRVPVDLISVVRKVEEQGLSLPGKSKLKNMSEKGVFLETDESFEEGNIIALELRLPYHMESAFYVGIVRWCKKGPPAGIGVEILRTSTNEKFL